MPKITREPAPDRSDFVRRLKRCEQLAGSQSALALNAGIPQSTIRRYTARNTEPPRDVLIKLARAAGVSTLWLATGEGPETNQGASAAAVGAKSSDGVEEIASIAAKLYAVPLEFARSRLSGSDEIKRVRQAMAEWSQFQPIPIVTPGTAGPTCCIIAKEDLMRACPETPPEKLAAYRLHTNLLDPHFARGDWALVDTSARTRKGTYCVIERCSQAVQIREIDSNTLVDISASKDRAGDIPKTSFSDLDTLKKSFVVVGLLVGAICISPVAHHSAR